MCYFISWVSYHYFDCNSVFLIHYYRNLTIWLHGSIMFSTSAWLIVCSILVSSTAHLNGFSSGCSDFLFSYLGNFPFISIRCARRSFHVISLSRHHYAMTYGSMGQEITLNFSCFFLQLICHGLKTYNNFLGIRNIPTSLCCPLAPLSLSSPLSCFLDI